MRTFETVFAEALENSARFPEFKSLYEFFQKGFCLTDDDRWKRFDLALSPWYKVLCEWFDDRTIEWIYLVQGSQTSKTTFLMGCLVYVAHYVRGAVPTLWVQSTEEEAKTFVTERLRPFLEASANLKNWKSEYFRVGNAAVKVGFGSAIQSLRTMPARFIFGDECGIWRIPIDYVKKRSRTFEGRERKGIFCTTPPFDSLHFSWREATSCDFFQWWVPCPQCGEFQALRFANLEFSDGKINGNWNVEVVKEITKYRCEHCQSLLENRQKIDMIARGKAVCVDPFTHKKIEPKGSNSRTLQITGLYSFATTWGQIACSFLSAKASGSLRVFFTDELAEPPKDLGETISNSELEKLIDVNRRPGFQPGYALYTAGVDVQRLGELYVVVLGWKAGMSPSAHVLDYFTVGWLGPHGQPDWAEFLDKMADYQRHLHSAAIDATDGVVSQHIYDFCTSKGKPYMALRDTTISQRKVEYKFVSPSIKRPSLKNFAAPRYILVNSDMLKDDIAASLAIKDTSEAWSFHSQTDATFLKHLTNEHRIEEKTHGRSRHTWKPKYGGAPQHYFSALVYAVAAMDEMRLRIQSERPQVKRAQISAKFDPYNSGFSGFEGE